MEAILALLLGCMILLGNATAEDCQTDNRMESVQHCIAQCPFSTLEGSMYEEKNQLNLWTTFHHPRKSFPQYLVIKYSANDTSDNDTYLWTSNSIYFVIPPQVFSFLSLFIGALDDAHTGETSLTLPEECGCWLNGSLYFTDKNCSVMNDIEILTDKLRDLANVSGTPVSASNYLYQSRAVRKENLHDIYQNDRSDTFLSFIIVLPILAVFAYIIIILSQCEAIKEKMKEPKQHQNFGALISLGLTIAWYITILDIFAVAWFNNDFTIAEIFSSKENTTKHNGFKGLLIVNMLLEFIICFLGEIWLIKFIFPWCKVCLGKTWNRCKNKSNTDHESIESGINLIDNENGASNDNENGASNDNENGASNDNENGASMPINDNENGASMPINDNENGASMPINDNENGASMPINDNEYAPVPHAHGTNNESTHLAEEEINIGGVCSFFSSLQSGVWHHTLDLSSSPGPHLSVAAEHLHCSTLLELLQCSLPCVRHMHLCVRHMHLL